MVSISIPSDSHTINVRIDDLELEEKKRVHECADLVSKFRVWKQWGLMAGLISSGVTIMLIFIGFFVVAEIFGVTISNAILRKVFIVGFLVSIVPLVIATCIACIKADKHLKNGIQTIRDNMCASSRCEEFMTEIMQDNEFLRTIFHNCSQQKLI